MCCLYYCCRVTVSAINNRNEAYYNHGRCVDISAPVSNIRDCAHVLTLFWPCDMIIL